MSRLTPLTLFLFYFFAVTALGQGQGCDDPAGTQKSAPHTPWLDEVRAQRQAWEARRKAARNAMEARRRWIDPWGAAQKEALVMQAEQMREAARNLAERKREAIRAKRHWRHPYGGYFPPDPITPRITPQDNKADPVPSETAERPKTSFPPPGWNNPWYFRGY